MREPHLSARHLRYANASTNGKFVCSAYCHPCDVNRRLLTLRTLTHNLAIGAVLCQSFALGESHEFDVQARNVPQFWPGHAIRRKSLPTDVERAAMETK